MPNQHQPAAASPCPISRAARHSLCVAPLALSLMAVLATAASPPGPSQAELDSAAEATDSWLMTNKSYDGHRYVALDRINTRNVATLRAVCTYDSGVEAPAQSSPVLHDGRIYFTAGQTTLAIDASDCHEIWRHQWVLKGKAVSLVNRGVAIQAGRLFRGTADGHLIALAMADGALQWDRQITGADNSQYLSMPAMVVAGAVVFGTAGADWGGRGWIGAFSTADGAQLWRYDALPKPGTPGAESWHPEAALAHGGASFWTPVVVDRARNTVFVASGNPAPDFFGEARLGDNLGTNSAVALDLASGQALASRQFVPHDTHDWDLTQVGPLIDGPFKGQAGQRLVVAGKDGRLRIVDRQSLAPLSDLAIVRQQNGDQPASATGVHVCPGLLGGQEWSSSAYDPQQRLVITPMVDWCGTVVHDATAPLHKVGEHYYGGRIDQDPIADARGVLAAVDASSGLLAWRLETPAPMLANVTATAGGITFAADLAGTLYAVDSRSGAVLLRHALGSSAGGGLLSYALGTTQYVAAVHGPVSAFFGGGKGTTKLSLLALP